MLIIIGICVLATIILTILSKTVGGFFAKVLNNVIASSALGGITWFILIFLLDDANLGLEHFCGFAALWFMVLMYFTKTENKK